MTWGGGLYRDPQKWLRNLWMTPILKCSPSEHCSMTLASLKSTDSRWHSHAPTQQLEICINATPRQCSPNLFQRWLVAPQIYIFHIYTRPKFTQIPNLHRTQIYTNPDLHGTHIYTAQIYTNPFPYIDSKKPKFTQPKFTQNPNLHNPTLHITQIYTKLFLQILLKLYKVNSIINPD